ncbi:Tol-Pal system beta propeller repeat protein TolB [Alkalimarinus alittae]|uniref:Tol-Pal system protein TolB n=1 Tax=Alkalimarinus alittae TaxID=2961619 RepID=A0ABY6N657_9ALTE|nr:Tol-Pal system beta propeller repeat protein TolB [Alkalimarinus alittae]UZE97602.1 Tol-Pal system beta propeller repeat protein TolB [Alkalimarinus alittae]
MQNRNVYLTFLLSIILVIPRVSVAELMIEITQGADSAIPIAVVPFANKSTKAIPQDIRKIIAEDLQRSGEFDPLATNRMLSLPTSAKEVYYRDWRLLKQNFLLIGGIEYSEYTKTYKIEYQLFDVNQQKRVVGEVVSGGEKSLRDLAHHISDAIYEAVTGIRGAFSTKISFITHQKSVNGKDEYRLQVADADGQRSFTLLKTSEPILSTSWSPDGKKLAYVSFESNRPAVYTHVIATGKRQLVSAHKGLNGAPAWSPDGKSLSLTLSKDGNAEIYRLDLATSKLTRLTRHYAIDTEASWSPDGRQLVFTSDRSGSPQVYRMNINDQTPERLTFKGRYNSRPRFSDDGQSIFYVHRSQGSFNIATLNLDTGNELTLTDTSLDESPSLAPNDRMLIYSTQRGRKGVLAVVSVDGRSKYFLPAEFGDVREPAWSPFLK